MKDVLLVDDENSFLLSLAEGLNSFRSGIANIAIANDGKKAIEMLRTAVFDVVVTDIRMPVLDGFALLEYLRKHHPHIPVIVMTAFGEEDTEQRLRDLRIRHYSEKPLDFREIAGKIITV